MKSDLERPWQSFDCLNCEWTVVAGDSEEAEDSKAHQSDTMHLTIHVSDAAYMDKNASESIIYELVPKYSLDEDGEMKRSSSWITGPCVRQSDMLLVLHQHLQRKHPHFLLPRFPTSNRRCPGWGSEALLQLMRRRLERYFHRLLSRPILQQDVALHDFMTAKGEQKETKGGLWQSFERWLKGHTGTREAPLTIPEDRILACQPVQAERFAEEVKYHDSIEKSIILRKNSLKSVSAAVDGVIQAVQRYSESLGRISKCIHEVTSSHVRHLITDDEGQRPTVAATTLQDDNIKATERRFRELGDRFVDLINQLQPGLATIHQIATATVMEVVDEQLGELGHVRFYVNREVFAMKRYDQAISRRLDFENKPPLPDAKADLIAKHRAQLEAAGKEEEALKDEFTAKAQNIKPEMELFWEDTSREFFITISQTVKASMDVGRLHIDALRAWFPPTSLD